MSKEDYIERDLCDEAGAKALRARLEAYWKERGHNIAVKIVESGFHPTMRSARFDVRSDLVNGLPPKTAGVVKSVHTKKVA